MSGAALVVWKLCEQREFVVRLAQRHVHEKLLEVGQRRTTLRSKRAGWISHEPQVVESECGCLLVERRQAGGAGGGVFGRARGP